jgi:GNAT superfamily N-acetyltransferase
VSAFRIEKIAPHHVVESFDCGSEALNRFLSRFALSNQKANAAQTYLGLACLGLADHQVIGFYSLVVGEIAFDDAPDRLAKGLARHPIPIMLLARLAVSRDWQGRGLGAGLLKDAMRRTAQAADIAGVRALAVHAKDDLAVSFYEKFDFLPSPVDPLHMFMLMKDLLRAIGG